MFVYSSPFLAVHLEFKLMKMMADHDVIIIEGTYEAVYEHPLVKD